LNSIIRSLTLLCIKEREKKKRADIELMGGKPGERRKRVEGW
jgi:hypothetical protein